MNECLAENYTFMNECLAENYTFMNVLGALAGLGIPIKEALRGFCNKIVTRLKHVSFPQKVDRQTASEARMEHKKALSQWRGPFYYSFCPKMEYSSPSRMIYTLPSR